MVIPARSLSFACLAALLASCVADDEPAGAELLAHRSGGVVQPVSMQPALDERGTPIPGTLVFETSEGRLDITHLVPERPRELGSHEELHELVVRELNGRITRHEDGTRSVTVDYTAPATLRYDHRIDDLVVVEDPLDAIIGGADGYVVIAGEQVCTSRHAACAPGAGLTRPVDSRHRLVPATDKAASGALGIRGTTWIAASSFLRWAGASTTQTAGTAGLTWIPCWAGGPSWCYGWSGSNFLSAAYSGQLSPHQISGSAAAINTHHVMAGQVELGVALPIERLNSTCATHVAASGPDAVSLQTGFGYWGLPFNDC